MGSSPRPAALAALLALCALFSSAHAFDFMMLQRREPRAGALAAAAAAAAAGCRWLSSQCTPPLLCPSIAAPALSSRPGRCPTPRALGGWPRPAGAGASAAPGQSCRRSLSQPLPSRLLLPRLQGLAGVRLPQERHRGRTMHRAALVRPPCAAGWRPAHRLPCHCRSLARLLPTHPHLSTPAPLLTPATPRQGCLHHCCTGPHQRQRQRASGLRQARAQRVRPARRAAQAAGLPGTRLPG